MTKIHTYIVTNSYHDEIADVYPDTTLVQVARDLMKRLEEDSKGFDSEIEDDWDSYYETYEKAQKANANSILETFIGETTIWQVPDNEDGYKVTYKDLMWDNTKYNQTNLDEVDITMDKTVYVARVDVLQDTTQSSFEVFDTYAKALVFIIEAMTESRDVWGEDEIAFFVDNNFWTDETDYDVNIVKKVVK